MGHASAAVGELPTVVIAGRYQVESLLGRGGMGAVHAVLDITSGRRLALKLLSSGASKTTAALFEREYHTLAGLRHPCIVEVYDYGTTADATFYTMELIDGTDLSKQAPMSWREVCRDLRDAASILGLLHARKLLHRDLSPRNLLRSRNGRLKLIDFGALAEFGPSSELVGTPPFVAPEALRALSLDQRTDLFALGALAYWLLTGVNAYPARTLGELPYLWDHALTAPSELVRLRQSAALEAIPFELDELVFSLLRIEPSERLASTAELIDQLNTVAELTPESNELAAQGYLDSKVFVGRTRERERAIALLEEVSHGHARTLLIEGEAGVGRSRFLQELLVMSRIAGALPILVSSQLGARPYGVAEALLLGLMSALPLQTQRLLAADAALLGTISPELRTALGVGTRPTLAHPASELRIRLLGALRDAMQALSRERSLVFLIDDVQAIDEESQALLATLGHAEEGCCLLIVASLGKASKAEASPALTNLRAGATRLRLLPLRVGELLELLRSVFGQAPYLERLAERLHRASEGNPAYCLELAEHLVRSGAARYHDGTWSLPAELTPADLPPSRQAAQVARLERLSAPARELARHLSVAQSALLSAELCSLLGQVPAARMGELLDELEREAVLRKVAGGHHFVHEDLRVALYAELAADERARAHLRLGEEAAAASDGVLSELRAAVHFLRGGDLTRGYARLRAVVDFYEVVADYSSMNRAAIMLEECYVLLGQLGQDQYGTVGPLGMLGLAGYFADRKYGERYGDQAIATLKSVLRLSLAERLSRVLGGKLALLVALIVAGISIGVRRRAPTFRQTLNLLMGAAAALGGTATCCLDRVGVARFSEVLRPFAVLGPNHAASIIYQYTQNFVPLLEDHCAVAAARLQAFIARLERPEPIDDLPDTVRDGFIAGCLTSLGAVELRRAGPECLQIAERLEKFSPLFAMNADNLRASFYASQGNLQQSQRARERMEVHAVQLGSAWQVETWAPCDAIHVSLRTNDAGKLKRAGQELGRLSAAMPSLRQQERHARAAYLVLRRKYEQAIVLLEADDEREMIGWARARGVLARAYNGLGQHERAREICLDALRDLTDDDLSYVVMYLNIQLELSLAEAGLGHDDVAKNQLDQLLARHAPDGSHVTLGLLHEARVRVAARAGDFSEARVHLGQMESHYRSTDVATLIELIAPLERELERAENPQGSGTDDDLPGARMPHALLRVELLLSEAGLLTVTERAQKGIQLALELSSADEGFIVLADSQGESAAHLGDMPPSPELVLWAGQSILDAGVDEQTVMTAEVDSVVDSNYKVLGQMRYCVAPLWAHQAREEQVVAALVLGFDNRVPRMPEPAVIRAIAQHLVGKQAV